MNAKDEQKTIASRFSASSATYDRAAVVQPMVVEKVFHMLARVGAVDRILEIGCGTGSLTEKLVGRFPETWIDAVDVSDKMIALSQRRLAGNSRIRWIISTVGDLPGTAVYPLIVSSSSLHWISPVDTGLIKLSLLLRDGGYLIFALMVDGTLGELRECRLRVAAHKPPLGSLPSTKQVRHALRNAGLRVLENREETERISYPSAAVLLQGVHDQGSTGGRISLSAAPMNRGELRRLVMDYDASYKSDGGVYATYCVSYFVAKKA